MCRRTIECADVRKWFLGMIGGRAILDRVSAAPSYARRWECGMYERRNVVCYVRKTRVLHEGGKSIRRSTAKVFQRTAGVGVGVGVGGQQAKVC